MTKPTPKTRDPIMDFHEMIHFVEKKHKLKTRGYRGIGQATAEDHFVGYCRITGDAQPNDGFYPDVSAPKGGALTGGRTVVRDGKRRPATLAEYDADFKLIHEQYARYKVWAETNKEPEYRNYWHWLLANHFYDVHNPCVEYWCLTGILDDEDAPDWVKEITQLLHDEFIGELDDEGGIEVEIAW